MEQFNTDDTTIFSKLRKAFHTDPIEYTILPACADAESQMDSIKPTMTVRAECTTAEDIYAIPTFPTIYFVNEYGLIAKILPGGPPRKDDTAFYNNLKSEIDVILKR